MRDLLYIMRAMSSSSFSIDAIMSGTVAKTAAASKTDVSLPPPAVSLTSSISVAPTRDWCSSLPLSDNASAVSPSVVANSGSVAPKTVLFRHAGTSAPGIASAAATTGTECYPDPGVLLAGGLSPSASAQRQMASTTADLTGTAAVADSRTMTSVSSALHAYRLPAGLDSGNAVPGVGTRRPVVQSAGAGYGYANVASNALNAAAVLHQYNGMHKSMQHHRREVQQQQQQQQMVLQAAAAAAAATVSKTPPIVGSYPIAVNAQFDPLYCWLQAATAIQHPDLPGFCGNSPGLFLQSAGLYIQRMFFF